MRIVNYLALFIYYFIFFLNQRETLRCTCVHFSSAPTLYLYLLSDLKCSSHMYKPRCAQYMLNSKAFRHDFRLRKVMQLEDFPGDGDYT